MKISSILAILVAVVFMGLTYFEYVPMYISVTIVICAFITYLSMSIVAAITALQETVKDEHKKSIECMLKPVESIINKLDGLVQKVENIKLQNDSLIVQIENCSKNVENVINEHSKQSNRILSEIKSQTDSNVQIIEGICDSLVAAITALQETVKDEHKKSIECMLKPAESIINKLDGLVQKVENIKLQNDSLIVQIENCSKNVENVINEHSKQSSRILSEIKSQTDSNVQIIEGICDSLKASLSTTTTEISKFNESLKENNFEIRNTINVFKNVVVGKSEELGKAIADTIQDMSTNIGSVTSKFSDLDNSINSYTIATNALKENNIETQSIVSDLITKLNDSTTNILRENRRFVDELKENSSNSIEALQKTIQNNISDQTDSLTEFVEDLQTNINKLSSTLSKNLEKLEVDVDAICASVDEMKQISQNVETTDKELLAKILKCKK